jgi:hypothetical protein
MGAVARITHATALVAKLLASSPAWGRIGMLPVLGGRNNKKKKRSATSRGRRRPAKGARPRRNSKR